MDSIEKSYELISNHNKNLKYNGFYYYISVGSKRKMHTLWSFSDKRIKNPHNYIRNIDDNLFDAVNKIIKEFPNNIIYIDSDETLKRAKRNEWKFLKFGKYKDKNIDDVLVEDFRYILWLSDRIYEKIDNKQYVSKLDNYIIGELQGKAFQKAKDLYFEKNKNSNFIGNLGEIIEINVILEKVKYYDSTFGRVYINIMKDENGNIIVYKGKDLRGEMVYTFKCDITNETLLSNNKKWDSLFQIGVSDGRFHTIYEGSATKKYVIFKELVEKKLEEKCKNIKQATFCDIEGNCYNFEEDINLRRYEIEIGQSFIIRGRIKEHNEFNNIKQTIIQRPKIIK